MKNKSLKFSAQFPNGKVVLLTALVLMFGLLGYFSHHRTAAQVVDKSPKKQSFYGPEFFRNSGGVDTSFDTSLLNDIDTGANVTAILKQPDGKLLVAGGFTNAVGVTRRGLVRLNPDLSVDRSFDAGATSGISVLAIQPDGKILVGGFFFGFNNTNRSGIIRLNPDGSIDTSFEVNFTSSPGIQTIIPLPNGKILITGNFFSINDIPFPGIAILDADGNADESFNPGVIINNGSQASINTAAVQPDGKILISGFFTSINGVTRNRLARLNADGTLDSTFDTGLGPNAQVNVILPTANGKILIGGDFTSIGGIVRNKITRLNADGSLDTSFNFNQSTELSVRTMILQPDGKILVAANVSFSQTPRPIFRLNADGSLDTTFELPAGTNNSNAINGNVNNLLLENDGKIIIAGTFTQVGTAPRRGVARLNSNGSLDTTFAVLLGTSGTVNVIAVQPDGKILIAGNFSYVNGIARNRFARLNADGSVDTTFSGNLNTGNSCCGNFVNALVVQPDGKILISGNFNGVNGSSTGGGFTRLNSDGSVDTSFVGAVFGNVQSIALQSDGKILVGGGFSQVSLAVRNNLARLNPNGSLDTSFIAANSSGTATGPNSNVTKIAIQNNGKILITGNFSSFSGVSRRGIALLNADGTLDTSFNAEMNDGGSVLALVAQPDGKILLGGNFSQVNGVSRSRLARLNSDGSLDTTFGTIVGQEGAVTSIVLQPDGKILIGGNFNFVFGAVRRKVARLNPDGSVDSIFNPGGGADAEVFALARQSDGRVLIGGNFTAVDGIARTGVARLRTNPCVVSPLYDFDGDGKTDISYYRPSGGAWNRRSSTSGALNRELFGLSTDRIVPGDYDADGKTDIAVYRPSEGTWYVLNSRTGFQSFQFGASEDRPIAADFDGDERDDFAVFRPSNGTWYIQRSSLGFTAVNFGLSTDVPVIADMDGDCRADVAVFRPSNGVWYWLQSSDGGFRAVQFGTSGDIPVAGDYDGDGRTDTAVYRPSAGTWFLLKSREGFSALQFGIQTDRPVPADYDGDGKTDVAVFRNGNWYILQSLDGKVQTVAFGAADDQPIPSAYLSR